MCHIAAQNFLAAGPELAKADIGGPRAHTTVKQGTKHNLNRQGILRVLRRNDEVLLGSNRDYCRRNQSAAPLP